MGLFAFSISLYSKNWIDIKGGWAQKLPLFNWLMYGRQRKGRDSIGNWETLTEFYWGLLWGELGRFLSLKTKRQRAWVTVWIKVVFFWGCNGLYTPKTRWFVRCSLSAKTGGISQSRMYSRRVFLDFTGCDLTVKRMEVP